jgi:hypothetical protein
VTHFACIWPESRMQHARSGRRHGMVIGKVQLNQHVGLRATHAQSETKIQKKTTKQAKRTRDANRGFYSRTPQTHNTHS